MIVKIGFGLEVASVADAAVPILDEIEAALADRFSGRSYGRSVEEVVLGIALVPQELYSVFPVRAAKYYKGNNSVCRDGFEMNLDNLLEIYVRPDISKVSSWTRAVLSGRLAAALAFSERSVAELTLGDFAADEFFHDLRCAFLTTSR